MLNKSGFRTLVGYVATRVLDTPFWGLYNLIPFILYKDLGATPFQIAFLVMLKPLVSFLSIYWSNLVRERPDRLVGNILWARGLGYLPFLFVPWVESPWILIVMHAFYMMLSVGIMPAWMELLKVNLPPETREKTFAYTQVFGYLGGGLFPFILGAMLDSSFQAWRWLFPVGALVGLSAAFFQARILIDKRKVETDTSFSVTERLKEPWRACYELLKERADFRAYQIGFMFVGSGFMILQPALPVFFVDVLKLSYTELAVAVTLCKGIGFALASPYWARKTARSPIFASSALVALVAAFFPVALILAEGQILWLWVGYLVYGAAQAGSELNWNLSGPRFSRDKESSLFSSVNVAATGFRGAIVPALGSLMIYGGSSAGVMLFSSCLALTGAAYFSRCRSELSTGSHDIVALGKPEEG